MIGHKTGIRSLWNTEERQQNDPSSHKDRGEQGCHYLSTGMTDWKSSLIASSLLRTDRNLGTAPTKQETWFREYLKSPPIFFCERLLEPDGWWFFFFFFCFCFCFPTRQTRSNAGQGQSIMQKIREMMWIFISLHAPSRAVQKHSNLSYDSFEWRIWVFHVNNPRNILHKSEWNIHVEIKSK